MRIIYVFYFSVILLFISSIHLSAQAPPLRLDSMISMNVGSTQTWPYRKQLFLYDSQQRGSAFINSTHEITGGITGGEYHSFSYNSISQMDTLWVQSYLNNIWEPAHYREIFLHDALGNATQKDVHNSGRWPLSSGNFTKVRHLQQYNSQNKLTSQLSFGLDRNGIPDSSSLFTSRNYDYLPNGIQYQERWVESRFDANKVKTSMIIDSTVNTFNANNQLMSSIRYSNTNRGPNRQNSWYGDSTLIVRNANGQIAELYRLSHWGNGLSTFTYHPNGFVHVISSFGRDAGTWVQSQEVRSTYDMTVGTQLDSTFDFDTNGLKQLRGSNTLYFDTRYNPSNLNLHSFRFLEYNGYYRNELGRYIMNVYKDANGLTTDSIHYYYSGPSTTSIEPELEKSMIRVAPNPASQFLNIYSKNIQLTLGKLYIHDMQGKLIIQQTWAPGEKVHVSNLSIGMYLLKLEQGERKHTLRFLKQ